ncbi:MAG TPA: isochorismatase family protein, partial [Terriglobales bacterium]|nr:isochorismatase family protein [Terriglobales bacterium]
MVTTLGSAVSFVDGAEIARRPLEAENCALLVIDIQEKLLPPVHERERLVRNSQLLIRLAKILHMPVIASTQYAKGLGSTVSDVASLLPNGDIVDKLQFS